MPTYHPLVSKRRIKKIDNRAINQKELALRIGIDAAKMGRYERGQQIPDYDDAKTLGDYYELPWFQIIEMCVEFRDRQREFVNFFCQKLSEESGDSHVCTGQPAEKCGAR
jgi:transcriptional regulator with XRE-family HTH domain